jgi:hypothetical protein
MPYFAPGAVPIGGIILWSGTIASIPGGWALCDGSANSPGPDLRDKFVVGAKQDDSGVAKTNLTGSLTQSGTAAVSAHTLDTNVAVSAHSLTTNVAVDNPSLSTNVGVSTHTLSTNVNVTASHATVTYSAGTSTTHTYVTMSSAVVAITQPVVASHSITQPVYNAHAITQPVVGAHTITQPVVASHTSVWPAYFALAYIQRMA